MDFYERVKSLVKSQTSLTLRAFIENTGINYDTYKGQSRYNNLPRADEAVLIARALHTTVEYLVTGEEAAPPDMINRKEALAAVRALEDKLKGL